jgi:hypothetical protein
MNEYIHVIYRDHINVYFSLLNVNDGEKCDNAVVTLSPLSLSLLTPASRPPKIVPSRTNPLAHPHCTRQCRTCGQKVQECSMHW